MSDPLFFVDVVFTEQPAALESVGLSFPDAILTQTNLTGVVSAIANDPDTDVGTWLTAASATAATDLRVSFPTPAANPYLAQNFRYLLRKTAGTPDPTVTAELRQANVLRKTIATGTAVTSTTGQVIQGDWSSTDLIGTVDGSDVELRLVSVPGQSSAPGALPAMNATAGTLSSSATLAGTRSLTIPTHTSGDLLVLVVGMFNTNLNQSFTSIGTAGWTQAGGVGWEYGVGTSAAVGFGWKIGNGLETTVSVTGCWRNWHR